MSATCSCNTTVNYWIRLSENIGTICVTNAVKPPKFLIFYDLETTQEKVIGETKYGEVLEHVCNLVCVQTVSNVLHRYKRHFHVLHFRFVSNPVCARSWLSGERLRWRSSVNGCFGRSMWAVPLSPTTLKV